MRNFVDAIMSIIDENYIIKTPQKRELLEELFHSAIETGIILGHRKETDPLKLFDRGLADRYIPACEECDTEIIPINQLRRRTKPEKILWWCPICLAILNKDQITVTWENKNGREGTEVPSKNRTGEIDGPRTTGSETTNR